MVHPNPQEREPDLKHAMGCWVSLETLDPHILMAGPKSLLTEFGVDHRLENRV